MGNCSLDVIDISVFSFILFPNIFILNKFYYFQEVWVAMHNDKKKVSKYMKMYHVGVVEGQEQQKVCFSTFVYLNACRNKPN